MVLVLVLSVKNHAKLKKSVEFKLNRLYQTLDQHYFYVAFEDPVCKDYVTHRFWNFKNLIVPIVLSRKIYQNFAPNHAFIAADDFNSPLELFDYLKNLVLNKEEYMR